MAEILNVAVRQEHGKRRVRRMRLNGHIPAVLYGHGKENVSLSVAKQALTAALRHGARLVELQGGTKQTALIRDVQWDPFGVDVLHVDLVRVSAHERIETSLSLELRGEAPGISQGGIVEQLAREVTISCSVASIPEKLNLNINSLELGQSLTAADLPLPAEVTLVTPPETVLAHCVKPQFEAEEEETPIAADTAEPEVIGRKEEEEAGDNS